MDLFPDDLVALAQATIEDLRRAGKRVTTAESCTGGLISGALTEIPGSSDVIGRSYVTYSNSGKHEVLGVRIDTLKSFGAVSEQTVEEMAAGALRIAGQDADYAVAVSGVAGPGGGSAEKPVGTVCMAVADSRGARSHRFHFPGDRTEVRIRTVEKALELLRGRIG